MHQINEHRNYINKKLFLQQNFYNPIPPILIQTYYGILKIKDIFND